MCKFNNRLFVFTVCSWLIMQTVCVLAKPLASNSNRNDAEDLGALIALSALMNGQDEHYDQRQKGDENYRVKLDGFFIGLPQEESSALLLLTDDIFESFGEDDEHILGLGKNKPTGSNPPLATPLAPTTLPSPSTSKSSEINENVPLTAENPQDNLQMVVEIPTPKKYLEARHAVNATGSKPKSYISQFLKLLKRGRKH